MGERATRGLIAAGLVLVLAVVNASIWRNQTLLRHGTLISLELAPVDPRSLMQGDYMALDWAIARELRDRLGTALPASGAMVVRRAAGSTRATLVRLDRGEPLADGESRIAYAVRDGRIRIATDAYYFQEGQADVYARARYGALRVDERGRALLVGLQDAELAWLGPLPDR
ncbi:MAG: GDYXXLXY domain-containing protein [Pigmentiphaga sp.]|uniref:GDYXXLXY domain-containing protein n=1 Tax=Pigmentiphaga sp. TaxID=1977564 RepID=UPI0029B07C6E|nr:GDYXXLXY domain-containing protein [Pigmentiphaga sp.]MDX3907928.1 GDYXXLXY domain-containing protein [Pigmentiphaga sp.]